jgi:hypothetical protein
MRTIRPTLRVVLTLLASCLGLVAAPARAGTIVRFSVGTTFFDVALSSDPALATTVNNFMNYVNTGRYTDTLIHRSTTYNPATIQIIQGGSYVLDGSTINPIATDAPIPLQANFANLRGTIAMARTADPNRTAAHQRKQPRGVPEHRPRAGALHARARRRRSGGRRVHRRPPVAASGSLIADAPLTSPRASAPGP